jgi:FkbM family methyltransferase
MRLIRTLVNGLRFYEGFRNPFEVWFGRPVDAQGHIRLVLRASGLEFRCRPAARRMCGETWFDGDYDIPRWPIRPGDVVIDIGGNHGFFTCYAAHLGAKVLSYEPEPDLFQSLQRNVENNGLSSRVQAFRLAVSDRIGRAEISITDELGGGMNSMMPEFVKNTGMPVTGKIEVETTTLEAILRDHRLERVRLCKIDCEGAELMILRALSVESARKVDAFVLEFHPEAYPVEELTQVLLSWGTHQVAYAEDKYCPRDILRVVRNDLLLVSPAGAT